MSKEIIFKISGKVQGVFFRANAKKQADRLGIKGYAQNEPDGRITIVAQGNSEVLDRFEQWCRVGPSSAKVEHFQKEIRDAQKNYLDFQIS